LCTTGVQAGCDHDATFHRLLQRAEQQTQTRRQRLLAAVKIPLPPAVASADPATVDLPAVVSEMAGMAWRTAYVQAIVMHQLDHMPTGPADTWASA
jgi:hypothetical protein